MKKMDENEKDKHWFNCVVLLFLFCFYHMITPPKEPVLDLICYYIYWGFSAEAMVFNLILFIKKAEKTKRPIKINCIVLLALTTTGALCVKFLKMFYGMELSNLAFYRITIIAFVLIFVLAKPLVKKELERSEEEG